MTNQVIPEAAVEPGKHWLSFRGLRDWGCDGCDWTSDKGEDFWKFHERRDDDILF